MNDSLRFTGTARLPLVGLVAALAVTFAACGGREDLGSNDSSNLDAGGTSSTGDGGATSTADTGTPVPVATMCLATSRRGTLAIDRFGDAACGLAGDGTIVCWGMTGASTTLAGTFTAIDFSDILCGVRTTGAIACAQGIAAPAGTDYVRVVSDEAGGRVCGLSSAGDVRCTASNGVPAQLLAGPYLDVATNNDAVCTLATDGTPTCTGYNGESVLTPSGTLQTLQLVELTADGSDGAGLSCGLTTAGAPTCSDFTFSPPVPATFSEISFEASQDESGEQKSPSYCGIAGCKMFCNRFDNTPLATPPGGFEHVVVSMALGQSSPFACASDANGHVTCFNLDGTAGPAPIGSPPADVVFQY
jgi:hypothetical protein